MNDAEIIIPAPLRRKVNEREPLKQRKFPKNIKGKSCRINEERFE